MWPGHYSFGPQTGAVCKAVGLMQLEAGAAVLVPPLRASIRRSSVRPRLVGTLRRKLLDGVILVARSWHSRWH